LGDNTSVPRTYYVFTEGPGEEYGSLLLERGADETWGDCTQVDLNYCHERYRLPSNRTKYVNFLRTLHEDPDQTIPALSPGTPRTPLRRTSRRAREVNTFSPSQAAAQPQSSTRPRRRTRAEEALDKSKNEVAKLQLQLQQQLTAAQRESEKHETTKDTMKTKMKTLEASLRDVKKEPKNSTAKKLEKRLELLEGTSVRVDTVKTASDVDIVTALKNANKEMIKHHEWAVRKGNEASKDV
jgi:hypothetical protein